MPLQHAGPVRASLNAAMRAGACCRHGAPHPQHAGAANQPPVHHPQEAGLQPGDAPLQEARDAEEVALGGRRHRDARGVGLAGRGGGGAAYAVPLRGQLPGRSACPQRTNELQTSRQQTWYKTTASAPAWPSTCRPAGGQ